MYMSNFPRKIKGPGEEHLCGKLRYSMYGTRDAAQNWHNEYKQHLVDAGFHQGKASPCIFYHPEKKIRSYVHGDDCVSPGSPEALMWMQKKLEQKYQVKTQLLGPGEDHNRQLKIFNTVVTWHGHKGITYEADLRHAELVIEQLSFKDAKIASTPGTRDEGRTKDVHEEALNEKESTRYRAVIAR